ncbi:MAG: S9 family peptidase, partial [Rubrivivax sp.]|nr:S9 family peptidase [Rubrivivax sp.]
FEPLRRSLQQTLESRERIPAVEQQGPHLLNFWRDASHPRGLWRRTTPAEFRKDQPAWETLLDLDAIAAAEKENWVWKGARCLAPETPGAARSRCLVSLSRGGADATVVREFDLEAKRFVPGGFALPNEAKHNVEWRDIDSLWVGTDTGAGSLTTSGYPRTVRLWKRGTPLASAPVLFEAQPTDVWASATTERSGARRHDWVLRTLGFWNVERYLLRGEQLLRVQVPNDATTSVFGDWLLVRTRTPWASGGRTWPGGALLATPMEAFLKGERRFEVLYEPTPRSALSNVREARGALVLTELDNVRPRVWELTHDGQAWQRRRVALPEQGTLGGLVTAWDSDSYYLTHQDFTTPTTLIERRIGVAEGRAVKSLPRFYDATGITTVQHEATSRDGTRIPYFVALREGPKVEGGRPTLLYGYGGFASSSLPWYSGTFGKGWLEPGGVLVLANLRGGGEFGPEWHRSAQRENKQRTWDDLAAVAEDLIRRGITSPRRLGIMGGSQGGLLVTAAMVQRPELFGAVVSQVPLVDMLRYHQLLAGASWMAEYGNPDVPGDRAFIAKYSPYQNVKKEAKYPRIFLVTSTRDDRVHPGHARKMAARMLAQG